MKTLEEGFAEVVKEFRGLRTAGNSSVEGDDAASTRFKERERASKKRREGLMARTKSELDVGTLGRGSGKGKEAAQLIDDSDTPEDKIIERYLAKGSSL